jgi:putative membrane protein
VRPWNWLRIPSASLRGMGPPRDPRFTFANERTFLAWNRTALALIAGGLAAAQLLNIGVSGTRLMIGLPFIALGAALAIGGFVRWRANEVAIRTPAPLSRSRLAPALLGVGAAAIALLALVLLTIGQLR